MRHILSLFFALFFAVIGYAQFDTTYNSFRNARFAQISQSEILKDSINWTDIDTNFRVIQGEATLTNLNSINLGQIGSPQFDYAFTNNKRDLFFGANELSSNLFLISNSKYYNVTAPLTRFSFFAGSKKEQGASFLHTQNIRPNLNVAVRYSRFGSDGYYINQRTKNNQFGLSANYISKNRIYRAFLDWNLNLAENQENGGLVSDSTFVENEETNRFSIPVNLTDAKNQYDIREFGLTQVLDIGKFSTKDSNKVKNNIYASLFLSNQLRWNFNRYTDTSPDSLFYESHTIKFDTVFYEDAVKTIRFQNEFGVKLTTGSRINPIFSVNYNLNDYKDDVLDTNFNELNYKVIIPKIKMGKLYFTGEYLAGIDGFNKNMQNYSVSLGLNIFSDFDAVLGYGSSRRLPHFSFLYYHSDSELLGWDNSDFKEENRVSLNGRIESKRHNFSLRYERFEIENYTYLDKSISVSQAGENIIIDQLSVHKLVVLNPVYLDVNLTYQGLSRDKEIDLPEYFGVASLYYQSELFKKSMQIRVGVRGRYYSSFYAPGYMPLSRQFYYQNEKEIKEYPFVDIFLKAKVKRFQVFLELSNAGQGIFDYNYISLPYYPQRDRNLRFGFQWDLIN